MSSPFPITIDGRTFPSAGALAEDIAERGDKLILPDRGVGHPSAYYKRWMEADSSGATSDAVRTACALLIDGPSSGDAFDHAVELIASSGSKAVVRRLLDRIEARDIPDSRWFGDGTAIAARALSSVSYGIQTRLPEERDRLSRLMERHGNSLEAVYLYLRGPTPGVEAAAIVERWASTSALSAADIAGVARATLRHPPLVLPMARALRDANPEARTAFLAEVDRRAPERSAEVAAALAQGSP